MPEEPTKKKKLKANIAVQMGEYYLSLMTHLIKVFVEIDQFSITLAEKKTVVFPEVNLKWPEIRQIRDLNDATMLFKLGNTQFQKALKTFIIDGYVTEHVKV